jgi:hypothetical protein
MFIIKFALYFGLSFLILSFPVRNRTVFYYMNDMTRPYTQEIFSDVKIKTDDGIKSTIAFGKKLFNNSRPNIDRVKTRNSAIKKKTHRKIERTEAPHGDYTEEERELLKKVLNQAMP